MNGIIILDKPKDYTSFDVIAVVRGCLRQRKTGHTGTLDPMATGVLPILLGSATKAQDLLPDTDKEYEAGFRFGLTTDTLDSTGTILSRCEAHVTRSELEQTLIPFRGDILQKPPMYSAVYKDGVRLYELARKGIEVEREARPVHVSELEVLSFDEAAQCGRLRIACSKGTYIRVICDDIGKILGCGCIMTALTRTRACGFTLQDAISLAEVRRLAPEGPEVFTPYIRPADSLFPDYPAVIISQKQTLRFQNGAGLSLARLKSLTSPQDGQFYRVYGSDNEFLGLGTVRLDKEELVVKKRF